MRIRCFVLTASIKSVCLLVMLALIGQQREALCTFPGSFCLLHVSMQGRETTATESTFSTDLISAHKNKWESKGYQGYTL